jgi:hypothetical protein
MASVPENSPTGFPSSAQAEEIAAAERTAAMVSVPNFIVIPLCLMNVPLGIVTDLDESRKVFLLPAFAGRRKRAASPEAALYRKKDDKRPENP